MNHQLSAESPFGSNGEDLWVVQRCVYRRGKKSTWKTITNPISYKAALDEADRYSRESTRLMTGIQEYFFVGAMQREI